MALAMQAHAADTELALPAPLVALLKTGKWDTTPRSFRIITLSFIADGCAAEARADTAKRLAASRCIDATLALAKQDRPGKLDIGRADAGLWLAHYALILGSRDAVVANCADTDEHRSISEALARRSLAEPTAHAPSFAGKPERYPADQAAVLAAIARYDRAHGTRLVTEPAARYDAYLDAHTDAETGLPWSQVAGTGASGALPRGCALSWQTRYLAEVLPERAARDWRLYLRHYLFDAGVVVGLREWPPGRDRPADIDSGPIVRGVGTAASALAIPAARRMGDDNLALRLEASAASVIALAGADPKIAASSRSHIAESIRYLGHVERKD